MSERLKRITELYGKALKEFLQNSLKAKACQENQAWDTLSEMDAIERFSTYDPSRNKSATQWLVTTYLNGGFLLEDLSKAYETLLVFSQVKRLLPVNQRSLNKYKTLASMWKTIEEEGLLNSSSYWVKKIGSVRENQGFPINLTSKEEKRAEKEKAYEESILVYQDDNLEVVVPLTEFAAKWHGKGTRWCTSADENNYFHEYNKKAPLIIIREKLVGGSIRKPRFSNKSQLWVTKDSIQFMDASDAPIGRLEEGDVRTPILKWALSINGLAIRHLPSAVLNEDIYLTAIKGNSSVFYDIDPSLLSMEMCRTAIITQATSLLNIPSRLISTELCMEAIRQDGRSLGDAMKIFNDLPGRFSPSFIREVIATAVRQDGMALYYVKNESRDEELCRLAVESSGALCYVPMHLRDKEMCRTAVMRNPWALRELPPELCEGNSNGFFEELCRDMIQQNPQSLVVVPHHLVTKEMAVDAIQKDPMALEFFNEYNQDKWPFRLGVKIYMDAVKKNGGLLRHVPEELINEEMCREAVEQTTLAIKYIPEEFRKKELFLKAVKKDWWALEYTPWGFIDLEMSKIAFEQDQNSRYFIPEEILVQIPQGTMEEVLPEWKTEMLLSLKNTIKDMQAQQCDTVNGISHTI